ncbi:adhesin, partial [Pseudomonas sp. FW300-N1A1]|uniref:retention module-containing protein n=1 Tax=Pseudomonas sp. FW300-N1A1 TaxID=2075555 RepID=UPI000CD3A8AE
MSSVVAIVKSIVGQVFAVSPEGIRRVLIEGDRLFVGDQLDTGLAGAVTLELADGRLLDLGRDTQWSGSAPDSSTDLAQATAQAAPSVEELQQAIVAGADPTTELEATAAGPSAAGSGGAAGGGHSFVMLDETAGRVDPTIGFPTAGIGSDAAVVENTTGAENNSANNVLRGSTLTLSATPTITEAGGVLVYTANVTQAPLSDLTITLSNGSIIVIPAGQVSGSVNVPLAPNDSVYTDPSQITVTVTGTTGGGGLVLTVDPTPAVTQVTDTIDTTTVTLTASPTITEGGQITYTATLTNPAQTPVTVTLSNGSTITIEAGKTTGTVNVDTPINDVYNNGSTVTTTITDATGGNFENLVPNTTPAVTTITDSVDNTGLTLTATDSITEGGQITYTATLTNPAGTPMTVTLSNGSVITIEAGKTTGSVVVDTPANDVYVNGSTVSTTIAGTTGGNFENLVPNTTPAVTTITDSVDNTGLTLTATDSITEGGQITYTATLTNPAGTPMTVTLSNGSVITIEAGKTTGSVVVDTPANDVYVNGSTVSTTIEGTTGGNFESLVPNTTPAVTTITDSVDNTGLTLTATDSITEGGQITYTATLTNPAGTPMTVTLSNGSVITIEAGKTTGSVVVETPANDVYVNGSTVSTTIEGTTGGNFESLVPGTTPAVTSITDSVDAVTVTIESAGNVLENAAPTFTIKVDQKLDHDLTVTLSNGETVVIAAGATETTYTLPVQGDDVYKDGETLKLGIADAVVDGKTFENLVIGDKASVTIGDTISEVTATLTVDKTTVTEGGSVTYTVTLTNAAGLPMGNHGELTFKLSDGTTITVPANSTTGSATVVTTNDIFTGGQPSLVNKLESVSGAEQFEQLTLGQDEYTTTVTDQPPGEGDQITVTIESNGDVLENAAPKFTVKVDQVLKQDLTVTLSNGDTVVIKAGSTETPYELKAQGDDVYKDGQIVEVGVTDAVIDGKSFENLVLGDKASVTIGDTVTEVVATLTVDKTTVTEGGQVSYTVTLTNAAGLPMGAHGPLEFTLSDGTVVKIPANGTSGTASVTANDDIFTGGQPAIVNKLESVSGAEQFEQLTLGQDQYTTVVTDEPGSGDPTDPANEGDKITVTIESNGDVLENAAPKFTVKVDQVLKQDLTVTLSNGDTVVIKAGTTETPYELKAQGDDVYKDGQTVEVGVTDATVDGKSFENLVLGDKATVTIGDTISEVTATLTVDKTTVTEGGQITYTVTLTNAAGLPMGAHGPLEFTLSDGTVVKIPANGTSGTASVTANDDIFTGGQPAIVNKLESVSGAEQFEQLTLGQDQYTTVVTDEPGSGDPTDPANEGDKITVTIESNGDVLENAAPKFTVKVDQVLKQDLTVTLSNGDTVVIKAGTTETPYELKAQGDDVYKDGQTVEVGIDNATVDGKSFENLVLGDKATVTIGDTISEVVATLSVDKTSVTEGGSVTYTVTLTNAAGLPMANHGELTFKLSDGTTITVPANSTTGSATVVTNNDIFTGGQPSLVNKLESVSGAEQFEKLTLGQDEYTTTITDQPPGEGDQITVTIESNGDVLENAAPKFTVKVDQVLKQDLTVTLSNGDTVVIKAGTTETPYELKAQGDDVYKDGQTVEVGVTDATVDGKSFENLVLGDKATVTIGDTISEVTATLTVDKTTVTEGGQITYTVTLTNAAGLPMSNHGELTFKLSDGTTITVPANSTTGSATVVTTDDIFTGGQPAIVNKLESVSGAEQFEQLTLGQDEYTTTITDQPPGEGDQITVTIESNGDVLENAAPKFTVKVDQVLKQDLTVTLSNGDTVVIKAGTTETPYELKAQGDDVYKDGQTVDVGVTDAVIDGKSFENLVLGDKATVTIGDTISEVTATLTVDKTTVTEGGQITYTVTLTNAAGLPMANHGELTFKLSDGTTITVPANSTTGSATVVTTNDIFTGGQPSLVNKLESVSGAEQFEKLTLGQDEYTTTITDQPPGEGDQITVTIESNGNVLENATPKFTVKVDQVL